MTTTIPYRYRARHPNGRIVKGRIDAMTQSAAISKVMALGVAPIEVKEVSQSGLQMEINIPGLSKPVSKKDLAVMSRQMATMIGAGLSLVAVLGILAEQTAHRTLREAIDTVRSDIEQGRSLSEALARHDRVFPPLMVNLIRAGETGGFLER
ncbi:MAG TPA: type II secretion system F family protein, partial [Microbacteriaceae bacterium]|nr:type II secretion system F family protein [Microbacteriaceae bacterium]